ncbi:hypothetical protein RA21_21720, partial [Leisingera sp. ANG-DT]
MRAGQQAHFVGDGDVCAHLRLKGGQDRGAEAILGQVAADLQRGGFRDKGDLQAGTGHGGEDAGDAVAQGIALCHCIAGLHEALEGGEGDRVDVAGAALERQRGLDAGGVRG